MKTRKKLQWVLLIAGVLVIVCLAVAALIYFPLRAKAFNSRPLVLIHTPLNNSRARTGDGLLIHASARSDRGLTGMELWIDDEFITRRSAPQGTAPTNLTLSTSWVAAGIGEHALVVRALSADGTEGQTAISLQVLESGEASAAFHTVGQGETLESIASEYGLDPEQIRELNPDIGPDGPAPGDDLRLPEGEPGGSGRPAEESGGEAPSPHAPAPGPDQFIFEYLGGFSGVVYDAGEGLPGGLRLEILSLTTASTYESLHCYFGFAGGTPRWYPDADGNQSTDESFAALGGGSWDITAHLAGNHAQVVVWPGDQPLQASLACVGIADGGTDALELGNLELAVPPENWDGIVRQADGTGGEGSFRVEYRVTQADEAARGYEAFLDMTMAPPTNLRLDTRRISLRWDYHPFPDEEPIDGFRVYLNGNLQWVEPPEARESGLPYEWFNPPCETRYTFTVTAFRLGFPDGPESPFASPAVVVETPPEDCNRQVQISFLTLETFDLGGDGHHEDRTGDVGPAYGYFFANDQQVTFDGRSPYSSGLDLPLGLYHNSLYDLNELSVDPAWKFNGMPSLVVEVPEDGTFEFGVHIMDEDTGRCHHSDDRGCDDLICEVLSPVYTDHPAGFLDQIHGGGITSEDGRCRLTYVFGPAFGSPVGTGVEGWEPLPWIGVENILVNDETGAVQVEVFNGGTATWPWKDLDVQLQARSGEVLGLYTWTQYVLEPGQHDVLEKPEMEIVPPYDVCVVIDPSNKVPEEYERSGALFHVPVCPELPDLTITGVVYEPSGGGRVQVTVQNIGEGTITNRTLHLEARPIDGGPILMLQSWPEVDLAPSESRTFELPGITEGVRARMLAGYTVTVNPDATIVEANPDNNTYAVRASTRLRFDWTYIEAPYDYRNYAAYQFDAYIVNGSSRRQIADWHIDRNIHWGSCFDPYYCVKQLSDPYSQFWFEINGDEMFEITIRVTNRYTSRDPVTMTEVYGADTNWGGGSVGPDRSCNPLSLGDQPGQHHWVLGVHDEEVWSASFNICVEDLGP